MKSLFGTISLILSLILLIVFLVTILCILLVSSVYFLLWLHDIILGNAFADLLKRGMYSRKTFIKDKSSRIYSMLYPEDVCARYETPLLAFCFSYITIAIISILIPTDYLLFNVIASMLIYGVIYLIGMRRKYKNSCRYIEVLEANLDFFKLSFIPISFFFTMIGFAFTVYGTLRIEFDFEKIYRFGSQIYKYLTEYTELISDANEFGFSYLGYCFVCLIVLCASLYIVSIPLQLIEYFFIQVVLYFHKHKSQYHTILIRYYAILKDSLP